MSREILALSREISNVATAKIDEIQSVTSSTRILALNAMIEATRAGELGKGFLVVANEVKTISNRITQVATDLKEQMMSKTADMDNFWQTAMQDVKGTRLADMALNMIDIIDRNLFERSCDVRWWATDSAMVNCLENPSEEAARFASKRLGVILASYTVYIDLWVMDAHGNVVANGRPDQFPGAVGSSVSGEPWFEDAMATHNGGEFVVADIERRQGLGSKAVATYATAIREGGEENGRPLGVLGIFFDWHPQAQDVVKSVRLEAEEKARTRALLVDRNGRVIAASDDNGILSERITLNHEGHKSGSYVDASGNMVGFALTPGYETYEGLGWYGVLIQGPEED